MGGRAQQARQEAAHHQRRARDLQGAQIGTGTLSCTFKYVKDKHELLLWALRDDAERLLEGGPRKPVDFVELMKLLDSLSPASSALAGQAIEP